MWFLLSFLIRTLFFSYWNLFRNIVIVLIIRNKKINKALGPDGVPARVLKHCADSAAPVLQKMFQASIDNKYLPQDWRKANITPIYKKGDKSCPANYRPVSLTSIPCKVLEHIIYHHIFAHIDRHDLLSDARHGFRRRRGCETQLAMLIEDVASALDSSDQIDFMILDFRKAFDKVPHQRLLLKLNQFGIKGNILRWTESFLTSRTQQVVLEGATSHQVYVTSDVPQGTVLGPLLFLIYINDIENNIDSQLRLFADDCLLYRVIKSARDCVNLLNDISQLCDLESTWQMTFNSSKCFVMHMSHKKNPWLTIYIMQDVPLQSSITQKYLGVELTSNLDWNIHINTITTNANKTLRLLRRHLRCCSPATKETAYKALVRPQMEYCSAVWDPYEKGDTETLEKVQGRAARFVKGDYR